jgi:hypothetical protein
MSGNRTSSTGKLEVWVGCFAWGGKATLRLIPELSFRGGRVTEWASVYNRLSGAKSCGYISPSGRRLRLFGCLMVTDSPVTGSILCGGYVQLELTRQLKDQ